MQMKKTVIGKYELIEELGRGGFATVYRARDTLIEREVALKVITGGMSQDATFLERFQREAQTAANLRHPHIVIIYDYGEANGFVYLAMQLGHGTLRDYIRQHERFSLAQVLPILTKIADALDYLKAKDLIHRDVKPANILYDPETEELVLTDFGLVRSIQGSTVLTGNDHFIGTAAYMAPEQFDEEQWGAVSPVSDVYALAVIAYEMLVGKRPFTGDLSTLLYAQANKEPPYPSDLTQSVADILLKGLVKQPSIRYQSAGEFVNALKLSVDKAYQQKADSKLLTQLVQQAQIAYEQMEWLTVQAVCVQILQINMSHTQALKWMQEAIQQLQRQSLMVSSQQERAQRYEEGLRAMDDRDWQTAILCFHAVAQDSPDFEDVAALLEEARVQWRYSQWFEEAQREAENGRWDYACRSWIRLIYEEYDYQDGEAVQLFSDAVLELLTEHKDLKLELSRYKNDVTQLRDQIANYDLLKSLRKAIEKRDWPLIVELGEEALELAPSIEWPYEWVELARKELASAETKPNSEPMKIT